ncbi:Isochorismatase-like protein [Macrophomina phaseolina MS6]|uniref:Isochorismatase-like protein n=1 Tax=Macrophomina phaseolina (strain MS6) TaxID=1126212 RepID=K2RNU2_MACPH|nr:Isochorismatase-like protein [Macrophomina phaseolina MS6]
MSSSFFADLLQQKQPQFQTNKALIVVGLQNDFCSPNGKLPVTQPPGLLDRIKLLVPAFREHAGHVIWVRTELQPNQPADDADDADAIVTSVPGESASSEDDGSSSAELTLDDLPPTSGSRRHPSDLLKRIRARSRKAEKDADAALEDELFLTQGVRRQICAAGSLGADWADDIAAEIQPEDTLVTKTRYSALKGTTLLLTLRSKLITELYVCGCISNISVYATAVEAARHGIEIYLVDDCVGYRKLSRHREAIRQMVEYMGAQTVSSASLIAQLTGETEKGDTSQGSKADSDHDLGDMLKNLKIKDKDGHQCRGSSSPPKPTEAASPPSGESAVAVSASLLEVADNDDALLDETTLLMERHSIRSRQPPVGQQLPPRSSGSVKNKIRMRRKPSQKSQSPSDKTVSISKEDDKPSAESVRSGQAAPTSRPKPTSSGGSSSDSLKTSTSRPETSKAAGDKADSPNTETVGQQSPKKESQRQQSKKTQSLATLPTLGPSDKIGEGDSQIIHNFLPLSLRAPADPSKSLEDVIFDKLYNEVRWQKMMHAQGEVPRLVSVQGDFSSDGSMPIYRHPSDESLPLLHFSPAVLRIRNQVEQLLKHPVNHVLIQLYRGGQDYISEHSDKTLDIVRGSNIVNVSFGAQRTMRLRTKRPAKPDQAEDNKAPSARQTQRISMPHNSVFVLGPQTNMRWLHGINADKRPSDEKSDQEKGFSGMRISLTFRHIGTFISSDSSKIWGQGATSKRKASAKHVINGDDKETDRLIQAFGKENQSSEFDWDQTYGSGSDVLHFRPSPTSRPETPILYTSHSDVEKQAVVLALDHLGLACAVVEPPPPPPELPDVVASSASRSICLRDTDPLHTEVCSAPLILSYLQTIHSSLKQSDCAAAAAATQTYLAHASHLYRLCAPFLSTPNPPPTQSSTPSSTEAASPRLTLSPHIAELLTADLAALEELRASDHLRRDHDSPSPYLVDNEFSVADCAVWPLVNALKAGSGVASGMAAEKQKGK